MLWFFPIAVPTEEPNQTTLLLRRMSAGDPKAAEELLPIIYDELHRIADRLMVKERAAHTLQPTALINEAFMRLGQGGEGGWEGRTHFLRTAARAMRSVLIDYARAEASQKRGGKHRPVTLHEDQLWRVNESVQVLAVHEGVEALSEIDEQLASIVELRFFGGFENKDVAELLAVSLRTVERGWQFARSWLKQYLEKDREAPDGS